MKKVAVIWSSPNKNGLTASAKEQIVYADPKTAAARTRNRTLTHFEPHRAAIEPHRHI
ncbi:hypothetical protein [Ruminococcus albus]|uniref:hypothetical protein n=1 Tax=Ruminococcus albus TaxID=1264 RepID=UPI0001E08ABA|nr:hypothetical protein [Ruminococcus albus]